GSGIFHRVANLDNADQIAKVVDERKALLVLQIDADFQRRLELRQPANLQLIADGRNSNTAGTATGYVAEIVERFNDDWRASHGLNPSPIRVESRAWFNPNLETR